MAQPEKSFRFGSCSASVFVKKASPKGSATDQPFYTVSLQRRYKDGEAWKTSNSFTLSDLPAAIAALQLAMTYVATRDETSG